MKSSHSLNPIILAAAACVVGFAVFSLVSLYQDKTIYSKGYSEEEFRAIRPGAKEVEVYRRLGPPLARVEVAVPETWHYAAKNGAGNFNLTGSGTKIEFNLRSRVSKIIGEGGSLKAGMSQAEVLRVLGDPQMTRPACDVILYYSQSGGSGSHEVRIIELSANGRVVRLVAQKDHD